MSNDVVVRPDAARGYDVDFLEPAINYRPAWAEKSQGFRDKATCAINVTYAHGSRGFFDLFLAKNAHSAPTLIFIHGGYWQKGDKSFYSFVAEPYVKHGVSCILFNYNFCPEVHISDITEQIRAAIVWIFNNSLRLGIDKNQLHISGHSAGAHLAGMALATNWSDYARDIAVNPLKSAVLISGIYDLSPLLKEPANKQLQLTPTEARAQSPGLVETSGGLPGVPRLAAVGVFESDAFHKQQEDYVAELKQLGTAIESLYIPNCNHFAIVPAFADPQQPLFQKTLELINANS